MRSACTVAALVVLSACSRQVTVKIGVVAPMSGEQAQYGKELAHGAEIAVDELNNEGFRIDGKRAHFELLIEDDQASAEEGKAAARRLIDAQVAAVFGHLNSGVTIAAAPLYANAGIPQMSASTHPKYTRMGLKTAFRIGADDIDQGAALGRLISEKLRAKSIFLIDDRTTFGAGLTEEVLKVLTTKNMAPSRESVDPKATDYKALAQKIKDANADAVFFGGEEAAGLAILKAMRAANSSARFAAGDTMCDADTIAHAEGNANGNYYCAMAGVPPSWLSNGINFIQMYKARFGEPGSVSPVAYDGIHIFAQAMQRAKSIDPRVYIQALAHGEFDGKIQGPVAFDDKGDIKDGTVVIYQSIGGRLTEQRNQL